MKTILLLLTAMAISQSITATVWIVDNNANSPQPIKDIQDAIDNYAKDGDTIMVKGSPTKYGDFIITKPLTIIGEGSHDESGESALSGSITIRASNVFITGFVFTIGGVKNIVLDAANTTTQLLSDIIIERCELWGVSFIGAGVSSVFHKIFIRNNVMRASINSNGGSVFTIDTLIIENNLGSQFQFEGWGTNVTNGQTLFIRNNSFIDGRYQAGYTMFHDRYFSTDVTDAIISNNIFYASNPQGCNNCTFMNNLTYANGANDTLPGTQNNNIYSQDPLFVNYTGGYFDYSYDFNLQAGSPCIDAGVGGTDMGVSGGYYPYAVGAGPKIPVVDFVNLSSSAVPENKKVNLQFDAHIRK